MFNWNWNSSFGLFQPWPHFKRCVISHVWDDNIFIGNFAEGKTEKLYLLLKVYLLANNIVTGSKITVWFSHTQTRMDIENNRIIQDYANAFWKLWRGKIHCFSSVLLSSCVKGNSVFAVEIEKFMNIFSIYVHSLKKACTTLCAFCKHQR